MRESGDKHCDQWLGISTDEIQRITTNRNPKMTNVYPLITAQMSRQHCLEWMQNNNYPLPPRSACYFCPYRSDDEWVALKTNQPESFELAVRHEETAQDSANQCSKRKGVPYLHRTGVSLDKVDFKAAREDPRQFSMMDECEGMCGV